MTWSKEAVDVERARRMAQDPWHYWVHSGRTEPPFADYFCAYCGGWYGVPHTYAHDRKPCRSIHRTGQCACIDCWVAQDREDALPCPP